MIFLNTNFRIFVNFRQCIVFRVSGVVRPHASNDGDDDDVDDDGTDNDGNHFIDDIDDDHGDVYMYSVCTPRIASALL